MNVNEMNNGDVFIAYVHFSEKDGGKVRPVVIFEDPEEKKMFACKVSSQVDKPIKQRLGYVLQDWKEAGFKKPSVVACDRENIREIDTNTVHKFVGRLTENDIKGLLIKHIKVAQQEYKKDLEKKNEIER